jgi:hypothetical protein
MVSMSIQVVLKSILENPSKTGKQIRNCEPNGENANVSSSVETAYLEKKTQTEIKMTSGTSSTWSDR